MAGPNTKYRPYLTRQQIAYIVSLVENDTAEVTKELKKVTLNYLRLFQVKYELGAVSSAYTTSPRKSIEDKLGLSEGSPAEKRLHAFNMWATNVDLCSPETLKLAQTYRYENNMMTEAEERHYEQSL